MGTKGPQKTVKSPFFTRKGNTLGGERWVSVFKAQVKQNTPKLLKTATKEDTQNKRLSLKIIRIFLPYPGYAQNLYTFTRITEIPGQTTESAINQE